MSHILTRKNDDQQLITLSSTFFQSAVLQQKNIQTYLLHRPNKTTGQHIERIGGIKTCSNKLVKMRAKRSQGHWII